MKRACVVALVVVVGVMIVGAGCVDSAGGDPTETPTPEPTQTETPEATDTPDQDTDQPGPSDEELLASFRTALDESGYDVDNLEVDHSGGAIVLDYRTYETESQAVGQEIAGVAGAYAEGVERGWDYPLFAEIRGADGEAIGDFVIDPEVAQSYADGELSDEEYTQRVLETLATY